MCIILAYSSNFLCIIAIHFFSTDKVKFLYERKSYGFHGFHFISLFIYKYFLDTSFAFANIRRVYNNDYVSTLHSLPPLYITTSLLTFLNDSYDLLLFYLH